MILIEYTYLFFHHQLSPNENSSPNTQLIYVLPLFKLQFARSEKRWPYLANYRLAFAWWNKRKVPISAYLIRHRSSKNDTYRIYLFILLDVDQAQIILIEYICLFYFTQKKNVLRLRRHRCDQQNKSTLKVCVDHFYPVWHCASQPARDSARKI